ncbi:MAG: phosphate/phosphite/phosphonate ABC transporter substrate-binding protein [Rhodocyclaceae bacterium]
METDFSAPRRRVLTGSLAIAAAGGLPAAVRAAGRPVFAIVPYLPARRLVNLYAPLLPVIEGIIGQKVEMTSAPDYREHLSRLRAGGYDIVADSMIHARIAQRELGHVPIARTRAPLEPVLVVRADTTLVSLQGLRWGAIAIATTDRTASLAVIGLRFLRDAGHVAGRDYRLVVTGSHANSVQRLLAGDVEAAIVSRTTLAQIDAALAGRVRILTPLGQGLAAVIYHVAPRLAGEAPRLTRALLEFAAQPQGRTFVAALKHEGLVPVTADEMASLDPFVVEFYRQMREEA